MKIFTPSLKMLVAWKSLLENDEDFYNKPHRTDTILQPEMFG
jgi:hypothetical protein